MAAAGNLDATLYVIPGSHPAMAARRMLELKGLPYRRIDLMPVISRGVLRALRFPSNTVPSLSIAGRKLTGSREIGRELDTIRLRRMGATEAEIDEDVQRRLETGEFEQVRRETEEFDAVRE